MADLVALNTAQTNSETDPFTVSRYQQFAKWIGPSARDVLDVGCNTGRGGQSLKAARPELAIVGLDLLQTRLDRLPKDAYAAVMCGSATSIPSDDETFDAIVAGEFIEHLRAPDAINFVHEAFRVLRLGGVLVLTTPNPGDVKRRMSGQSILGGCHVSQHHPRALTVQLEMAGFASVAVRGSGKVSWYLGTKFPLLNVYGAYLITGKKF